MKLSTWFKFLVKKDPTKWTTRIARQQRELIK